MSNKLTTQYISRRLAEARIDAFDGDEFARLFRLAPAQAYRGLPVAKAYFRRCRFSDSRSPWAKIKK